MNRLLNLALVLALTALALCFFSTMSNPSRTDAAISAPPPTPTTPRQPNSILKDNFTSPESQGQQVRPMSLYTDTLTPDGRIVPILPPAEQPRPLSLALGLGPTIADVTLSLRDQLGNPVSTACVQAFSEDWKVVMPRRWERVCADATGAATIQLPVGHWSFFAAGWAYFVPLLDQAITGDTSLVIQASSSLTLEIDDFAGRRSVG